MNEQDTDNRSVCWRSARHARLGLACAALLATLVPTTSSPPAVAADAASLTATERCSAGETPDVTQTVFVSGTSGQAFYPRAVNPDNAIFPGDVVSIEVSGQLRYNSKSWTGPEGTGMPDANGVRPYAATATWDRLPGGPVGPPLAAVDLGGCTSGPTKVGVRLRYGINEKLLSDNAGGYTVTTRVWRAPGRLIIDRTEVTQGVQDRLAHVALVAGKRTFVRVFLRHQYDGSTSMAGVTGTLRVTGVADVARPLVNSQITSLTNGGDPRRLSNSLLFAVPTAALAEGTREAVVTVTPPAGRGGGWSVAQHFSVTFGPTTSLPVIGLRYSYHNVPAELTAARSASEPGLRVQPGRWQAANVALWGPMGAFAENVLPFARLSVTDDAPSSAWGTRSFDCEAAQRPDDGLRYCDGYQDAIAWAKRVADQECPDGGCLVVLMQPEVSDGGTGYCHCTSYRQGTPRGNSVINLQWERMLANQGRTLAHEIGHYYGVVHTWDDPHFHFSKFATIGDIVGLRYANLQGGIELQPERRLDGTSTYDLMTYQPQQWLSVYNYCRIMHEVKGLNPVCAPGWEQ
ncbi:hypothetical protein F0U44_08925 [Nocardioides humilatus]|uniref:Uncharacterized protein n=1 Tax=Nocardioides humilatus TaxID=2607660 RepID=A0A5B1LD94_9ACTN|nr:hypothetical protein [Nocardioides humilatus]KAA1418612.1 hypothetical protein F0U44_08925 [Nocardioides humilatus]